MKKDLIVIIIVLWITIFYGIPGNALNSSEQDCSYIQGSIDDQNNFNKKRLQQHQVEKTYLIIKAANKGFPNAQYILGCMYSKGHGLPKDCIKAVYWYQKAAEQGHSHSQVSLGYLYESGKDIAQNYDKALYWYTKAAMQGDRHAQANLGCMYGKVHGVLQDYTLSYVWSYLASLQGNEIGKNNRDRSAAKMTIEQAVEAHKLIKKLMEKMYP